MQIQFRRGDSIPATESAAVGEPFYDPIKRRLGMFPNVSASQIDWYPLISNNAMHLNEGQLLTGKATGGVDNNIVLDWSTANQLVIRNAATGTTYATFQEAGVGLLSPVPNTDVTEGINNRAINGNLAVIDPLSPSFTVSTASIMYRSYAYQPGWLLWKKATASGDIAVNLVAADANFPGTNYYFNIATTGAPNGHGLRQYYSYHSLVGRTYCVGGRYIGTSGSTIQIRVTHDSGAVLKVHTHTATGAVDDVFTTGTIPSGLAAGNICVDYVYNPSTTIPGTDTWKAGRFFLNLGSMPKPYESLGYTETLGLLRGTFTTGKLYAYGADCASAQYWMENLSDIKTNAGTTVLASDNFGAALANLGGVAGTLSVLQYSVHSLVRNAETV